MDLWLDLETTSAADIAFGVHRYAEEASVLLFSWAVDDEPAQVWDAWHEPAMPADLEKATREADTIWAHNSAFDRNVLARHYPWMADAGRWKDTMVLALSESMPAALGDLCAALGLPADKAKDRDGKRLIRKFCLASSDPAGRGGEDWDRFVNYARLDVEAMREVHRRLSRVNDSPALWREWRIDQRINDRGVKIDLDLVHAAQAAAKKEQEQADADVRVLSGGRMATSGQLAVLREVLADYGVELPDARRQTLESAAAGLPEGGIPRRLVEARLRAGKTSTKKFDVMAGAACRDGRIRGCFQFMGASRTARFSGRMVQLQNIPRGSLHGVQEVEECIEALKAGVADLLYPDVQDAAASCLRGCLVPEAGMYLAVADLSNIEGRVVSWLAGEEWKLEAFRAYDRGEGPDLYKATYARTFGIRPEDVTKEQRQIGKIMELALGYGGGVGAFATFARTYGTDLDAMADIARGAVPPALWGAAETFCLRRQEEGADLGMSPRAWTACDAVKRAWRAAHPAICAFWQAIEQAFMAGKGAAGRVRVGRYRDGLAVRLPSGRLMCYPRATTSEGDEKLLYWGPPPQTMGGGAAWRMVPTHGGKLTENVTQAVARDVLVSMMAPAEAAGCRIVSHVHDELITEVDDPEAGLAALVRAMQTAPAWAPGLPLSAAGFSALRYRKD